MMRGTLSTKSIGSGCFGCRNRPSVETSFHEVAYAARASLTYAGFRGESRRGLLTRCRRRFVSPRAAPSSDKARQFATMFSVGTAVLAGNHAPQLARFPARHVCAARSMHAISNGNCRRTPLSNRARRASMETLLDRSPAHTSVGRRAKSRETSRKTRPSAPKQITEFCSRTIDVVGEKFSLTPVLRALPRETLRIKGTREFSARIPLA